MKLDETILIEIQDYINALDNKVGLKPETVEDLENAIDKCKAELKKMRVLESSIVIRDDVPDEYWYSNQKGNRFNIRHTHKSELRDIEGFGHCYGDDCWAVADGEFKGNVILRQHCL